MNFIKHIIESFKRKCSKIQLKLKFLRSGSWITRILHTQGVKYLALGSNVEVYPNARIDIYKTEDAIPNFVIENDVVIGYSFTALVTSNLIIEKNVLIASHVFISTENHGLNPEITYLNQPLISADVKIRENAWIGEKVIILPGVTIGKNSIIGAGSVVTKSIPDFAIACGNPAKVIKIYNVKEKKWEKKC